MHDWLERHRIESCVLPCRVAISNCTGAWCVGIGQGYPDDRAAAFGYHPLRNSYNGHLLVRVDDFILDTTLGQVSDHRHGIFAGPLLARVSHPTFFVGITPFSDVFRWDAHPPNQVTYAAEPTDLTYQRTHDWHHPQARELGDLLGDDVAKHLALSS